jgi:hypothetical protein
MSLESPTGLEGGSGGGLFDGGGGGSTQPSLTVTGRVDGEAYTVTSGARSLSITAAVGATLATTVELASDGSSVTVTDSTTTTPSWTAPTGGTDGDAYQVRVVATLDGLTSSVAFTERISGTAATEPSLTVTGRADGEAYTVTSGGRSLTISNPDGATLSTSVELASDGSSVPVTDSTTTTPSWTAPAGGAAGDAYQVRVAATLGALTSTVGFTERLAGAAAPSVSVSGRTDGEAYTVTGGAARSLSITADPGATLSTTVEVASSGLPLAVTDSTTTTPSWTAPAAGDYGEAVQVQVTATASGASSTVSFTERVAGAPVIPAVNTILDIDWQQLWIDNGSVDVDLSVNGTYTLNGEDYIVDRSTTGQTVTLKSTGLELVQTPGASMDWSIAFGTSLHANAGDNRLLTADMTSAISSATSGSGIGAAAVVGFSQSSSWGSQPLADWVGAGWDINGSTSQDLVCVVRGTSRYVDTDRQSPKVNPTSSNHRLYVNGSTYGAAHNPSAAFDGSTLKPVGAVYTAGNSDGLAIFPPDSRYTGVLYCSLWAVGGTGTQMVWTVTRSTWRAWPVPK